MTDLNGITIQFESPDLIVVAWQRDGQRDQIERFLIDPAMFEVFRNGVDEWASNMRGAWSEFQRQRLGHRV